MQFTPFHPRFLLQLQDLCLFLFSPLSSGPLRHVSNPPSYIRIFPAPSLSPLAVPVISAMADTSGTSSRVLQNPLSHSKIYGVDHPPVRRNSRVKRTHKTSKSDCRVRDGNKTLVGRKNSSGVFSRCPVSSSNGRRKELSAGRICGSSVTTKIVSETRTVGQEGDGGGVTNDRRKTSAILSSKGPSFRSSYGQKNRPDCSLPPVEADSPHTVKRTHERHTSVSLSRGSVRSVHSEGTGRSVKGDVKGEGRRVRGAWTRESGSYVRPGAHRASSGTFSSSSRKGTSFLLSEMERVSSVSSFAASSSALTSHPSLGRGSAAGRLSSHTPTVASFSRWTSPSKAIAAGTHSLKPPFPQGRPHRMMSSGAGWRWGRGERRQLELQEVAVELGRVSFKNVIVMSGAGISTPSGIPDFRTPGSGLYDNLQKYQLPEPSAVFDIVYFHRNPRPFFSLAKELYPGQHCPSLAHCFLRLLQDKGVLLRNYTQNIDGLERLAGVQGGRLVEAHGSFSTASCTRCHSQQDPQEVKATIIKDEIPRCQHRYCKGVVKPDIVFFGEDLPQRFHSLQLRDFSKCDLLLVMGTSLEVEPFASLVTLSRLNVPRVLLNREPVGPFRSQRSRLTDVTVCGDVVEGVRQLAQGAGWGEDLDNLHRQITGETPPNDKCGLKSTGAATQLTTAMDQLSLQHSPTSPSPTPSISSEKSSSSSSSSKSSSSLSCSSTSHDSESN